MSLLFVDGFDLGDFAIKGYAVSGMVSSTTTPYGIGSSLQAGTGAAYLTRHITPSATVYVGFQYYPTNNMQKGQILVILTDSGSSTQLSLWYTPSTATITLYLGPESTVLATAAAAMNQIWNYIEMSAVIDPSAGSAKVRINGVTVITFSGNTKYTGTTNNNIDTIGLGAVSQYYCYFTQTFDDLYVCNGLGTVNNTFLGPARVQFLVPDAAGTDTNLTPNPVRTNYLNVADVPYLATDYNYSATTGTRDTYLLSHLAAATSTVYGIQTNLIAQASDSGAINFKPALYSGGTLYYDPTVALSASVQVVSSVVRETDPATSAPWTVTGVNSLQAGAEVA